MKNLEKYIKPLSEHYLNILSFTAIVQVILFLTCILLKKSNIMLHIVPFSLIISMYIMLKDYAEDEKHKNFSLTLAKLSSVFVLLGIANNAILNMANKLSVLNPDILNSSVILIFLVDAMIALFVLALLVNDTINEKIIQFHNQSTKSLIGIEEEEEIKPGDAVIGYTLDTNKPVILPLKDRYLHMLIIGPTGSGKTSQSVIPMINRDMTNNDIGITVIEPKGDLAEKIFAMARYYNREVLYFNPILPDCPYFNPLFGCETDVIENMATTFKMLNPDSSQFFLDMNENTTRKALKILKRLYGDDATLLDFDTLLNNTGGQGKRMVMEFSKMPVENPSMARENSDIAQWFLNDYYSGLSGERGATKTFEHCSGLRSQVAKLTSNVYLRKVLNPPKGMSQYGINFDDALARGTVITIATAQGTLRDLGRYLGYFIILQLQASVFRRPGNEYTRKGNMLYIDEFQVYTNPGFADMLTQGRSYRVASH